MGATGVTLGATGVTLGATGVTLGATGVTLGATGTLVPTTRPFKGVVRVELHPRLQRYSHTGDARVGDIRLNAASSRDGKQTDKPVCALTQTCGCNSLF
jgi:hypothetical protein